LAVEFAATTARSTVTPPVVAKLCGAIELELGTN
jgi:hypothetical protein